MEINQLISLLRKWLWLIVIGLLVGLLAGYIVSRFQEPTYQATTKLLVSRNLQNDNSSFAGLNNQQLAMTYVQILQTKNLRDETSNRLDTQINSEQVTVALVPETQIVEIAIQDTDPERAANIANTMVLILLEENETTQSGQFATLETSLTSQISQVEEQIVSLQEEYDLAYKQNYQTQLEKVNEQIASLSTELSTLQLEIANLTDVLTIEGKAQLSEKQAQATQLQSNIKSYNDIRTNLLIIGRPAQLSQINDDPKMQQLRSTIDLYQQTYLNLLSSLENTRLARLRQTPNVVQIEEAFVPTNPIRPIVFLNTFLSGLVVMVLTATGVFVYEFWGTTINQSIAPIGEPKAKPIEKKKIKKEIESAVN